jgi:hypothetical protein
MAMLVARGASMPLVSISLLTVFRPDLSTLGIDLQNTLNLSVFEIVLGLGELALRMCM